MSEQSGSSSQERPSQEASEQLRASGVGSGAEAAERRRSEVREQQAQAQQEAWEAEARKLGADAGRAAGSWVTDGNESSESRRRKLAQLAAGDPESESWLPREPNLSGEYAGEPTPASLFESVTGLDAHAEASWSQEPYQEVLEALCQAFEEGASEALQQEAERCLLAAEGLESSEQLASQGELEEEELRQERREARAASEQACREGEGS